MASLIDRVNNVKNTGYINWNDAASVYAGLGGATYPTVDLPRSNSGAAMAYRMVIAVRRASDLIADAVANLTLNIYYNEGSSKEDGELIASTADVKARHPFTTALRLARADSGINYLKQVVYARVLYGEVYTEKMKNQVGLPAGIRWLNPLGVQPIEVSGKIAEYHYSWDGDDPVRFYPGEIAYFRTFNPERDNRGSSKTLAGFDEINIKRNLQRYLRALFVNNSRPGAVFNPEGDVKWSKTDIEKIERTIREFFKGVENSFGTMVLPVKGTLTPFENPDIQKQYSVDDPITRSIFMLYGVPLAMAGDSSSSTYKDGQEVLDAFYTNTVLPMARDIAEDFNTELLTFFDSSGNTYCEFDETRFSKENEKKLKQTELLQSQMNASLVTIGDAQRLAGLEPDPQTEDLYMIGGVPVPRDQIRNLWQSKFPSTWQPAASLPVESLDVADIEDITPEAPAPALPDTDKAEAPQDTSIILSLANNVDLTDLQKRLKEIYAENEVEWTAPEEFHITLITCGGMDFQTMSALVELLRNVEVPKLALNIGSVNSFDNVGTHAIHFRIRRNLELLDLQEELHELCQAAGIQTGSYSRPENYVPHITMGYGKSRLKPVTFKTRLKVMPDCLKMTIKRGDDYETVLQLPEVEVPDEPPANVVKAALFLQNEVNYRLSDGANRCENCRWFTTYPLSVRCHLVVDDEPAQIEASGICDQYDPQPKYMTVEASINDYRLDAANNHVAPEDAPAADALLDASIAVHNMLYDLADNKRVTIHDHHDIPVDSWDYTPEKALAELKAWRKFVTNGKKSRAFTPHYLRGDIADAIQSGLDSGASPTEVFAEIVIDQGIEVLYPAFESALTAALNEDEELFTKSIAEVQGDFENRFGSVIGSIQAGDVADRRRAGNLLRQMVRTFGYRAYVQGMRDAGVQDDPDEQEQAEIAGLIGAQSGFVSDLTSAMIKDGISDALAAGKARLWFNGSIMPFYNAGLQSANANLMLEFGGEDGEESCRDCQRLKGQRHRVKAWKSRNLMIPMIGQATECEGWNCQHRLIPVNAKARGKF